MILTQGLSIVGLDGVYLKDFETDLLSIRFSTFHIDLFSIDRDCFKSCCFSVTLIFFLLCIFVHFSMVFDENYVKPFETILIITFTY